MVEPGRRCLGDRYALSELIAAGGMGQVWRGEDELLGRPVAVKVLRSEYTGDPTFLARFRAEAQHAASLSHPNIAAVFDYGEATAEDGTGETLAYLVMELVEGEPLSTLLHREGRLDLETALSVLRQTAFALAEAHRVGLVHRDVKPGNILVRADGTVKITDFGIAWSAGSVPLTRTGQVVGTPQYLSPEVAEGRLATPASDVYALGLVGYECLAGHTAFDGDNPVTIALKQVRSAPEPLPQDVPATVRGLIDRSLVKDPAARIPDAAAFLMALEDAVAGREPAPDPSTVALQQPLDAGAGPTEAASRPDPLPPVAARPTGSTIGPPAQRRRSRAGMVLLPLLALLVGAGIAALALHVLLRDQPSAPAAAAEEEATAGLVVLDPRDYVGRPVDDVATQLSALGLRVERRPVVTPDTVPDMVTEVSPAGIELAPGDRVVVSYAVAPSAPMREEPAPRSNTTAVDDDVPVEQPAPPVETTPSAVPSPVPSSTAAPESSTSTAEPSTSSSPSATDATDGATPTASATTSAAQESTEPAATGSASTTPTG